MASDHKELLYVMDEVNHRVQAFTRGGRYLFEWGRRGSAPGEFECDGGCGMTVDESGYVWVADAGNHRVQKFATRFTPTAPRTWGEIKARYR
jgi:sugar lactone lactonase YvrE